MPKNYDCDEDNHNTLNVWQDYLLKNNDTFKEPFVKHSNVNLPAVEPMKPEIFGFFSQQRKISY